MSNPDRRPPAPPWQARPGAGPPSGAGWAGSIPGGFGAGGFGNDDFGKYADFSPPSYGVPPAVPAQPAAEPPPAESRRPRPARRTKSAPREKSALPWIVGGLLAVVLAAIVLVLGFVAPGSLLRNVFDSRAVADGVHQILRDAYRVDAVRSVSCPADQPAEPGARFDCRAVIGDESKTVTVSVVDADGRFEVSRPR